MINGNVTNGTINFGRHFWQIDYFTYDKISILVASDIGGDMVCDGEATAWVQYLPYAWASVISCIFAC